MRGRTLGSSYVIDEAQNTTPVQMKMVLTPWSGSAHGHHWRPQPDRLPEAILRDLPMPCRGWMTSGIGVIHLSGKDVVRHPVVAPILTAYDQFLDSASDWTPRQISPNESWQTRRETRMQCATIPAWWIPLEPDSPDGDEDYSSEDWHTDGGSIWN